MYPYTIPKNAGSDKKCRLCEKHFGKEVDVAEISSAFLQKDFGKSIVDDHCQLAGEFKGLGQNVCNLNKR